MSFQSLNSFGKVSFLRQLLTEDSSDLDGIVPALLSTHAAMDSAVLRDTSAQVLIKAAEKNSEVVSQFIETAQTSLKSGGSSAITLLLEWANALLVALGPVAQDLLSVQAKLLLRAMDSNRPRLCKTSLRQTRAACTKYAVRHGASPILDLLKNKSLAACLLAGALADGAAVIAPETPAIEAACVEAVPDFVAAYIASVLGPADPALTDSVIQALGPFMALIPQQIFDEQLVPAYGRAMLRSAELTLVIVLPPVIKDQTRDLNMNALAEKLEQSLQSNLSSSSPQVRQQASEVLGLLLSRGIDDSLVTKIATNAKKATNPAQSALYAHSLARYTSAISPALPAVIDTLSSFATKVSTEAGVSEIAKAVVNALPESESIVVKGLQDSRNPLRRIWAVTLASGPAKLTPNIETALKKAYKDIASNVNAAISFKCIAIGYACVLLGADDGDALFDPRVYERLTASEDLQIGVQAAGKRKSPESTRAMTYLAASQTAGLAQTESVSALGKVYQENSELGVYMAQELSSHTDKWSRISAVIKAFGRPAALAENTLVALIVTAHHQKALPQTWVGLCARAQVDAGAVASQNVEKLLELVWDASSATGEGATEWHAAAASAIATLAFVAPQVYAPHIVSYLERSLLPVDVTADDITIFRTAPGELAMTKAVMKKRDVTERGRDKSLDAWEAEVRRELAAKNGGKLSKEDTAMMAEQTVRRNGLEKFAAGYKFALSVILALSKAGVENGQNVWFPRAITLLIKLGSSLAAPLADVAGTVQALTANISARFTDRREDAGKALCSAFGLISVPNADDIAVRVLYRAKMLGDQRPFDAVTLAYLLPLLTKVVRNRAFKTPTQEEMLLLTFSVLASHADELATVPRDGLVVALLKLLSSRKDKAKDVKECLQRIAQGVLFDNDELSALLSAVVDDNPYVRVATLEILDQEVDLTAWKYAPEIYIASFAEDAPQAAADVWSESGMSLPDDAVELAESLRPFLGTNVRHAVAKGLAAVVASRPETLTTILDMLYDAFRVASEPPQPVIDEFGLEIKTAFKDPWPIRCGVATSLNLLVPVLSGEQPLQLGDFVAKAVGDSNNQVDFELQTLGAHLVACHGAERVDELLTKFENLVTVNKPQQAHVVLYGLEARHLAPSDPRLPAIAQRLLDTLDSSERVQQSVSEALSALASRIDPAPLMTRLLESLGANTSTDSRRGAAYGLAGLVGGLGLVALTDYGVIRTIQEYSEDKREAARREGAQLAVDCLSQRLNNLFEPYALELLPLVLAGLGDMNNTVREAAATAARSIMKVTTTFGISKSIPLAINRLDDTAWRGKKGAVELLGTMAYLDPQQLSASLSTIVPEIVAVLNDTHKEVRAAAKNSLHTFGDVIENAEIKAITPQLLDAISDPTRHTESALDALLATKFVHYIDSPSLALVIHVVKRGMRDRSANTKRRACQVVGNMSILTDGADLVPYLPEIMPDLQVAMTDPVPATCATACKALGALVEKLGEEQFPDVIPNMLEILRDPTKIGDRWGCAQGLAEVTHGLGVAKLEELLPLVVKSCANPQPHIRQSFVLMLLFLPAAFGPSFTPYLSQIVPAVLQGLADSVEEVRENALKAGRLIVRDYAAKAVDLLLPELERGLSDTSYRIRLSSVELTGDLMFRLAGISKTAAEDGSGAGAANQTLVEALGQTRRDRILAALFICRADVSAQVRTSALDVWMALVANTPRTVKEILSPLTHMLVRRLASSHEETQTNAARALGELVRRVSGALVQLLPTLEELASDPESRQGICVGLVELIVATPTDVLREHERALTALIRGCLTDPVTAVREAASQAFDALQEALGEVASDLLPELIAQMQAGDDGALAALKEMMSTSADVVFPALVPKLIEAPITDFKASSLADICEVAGDVLYSRLESIVDALLSAEVSNTADSPANATALDRVLGVALPEVHLLEKVKAAESATRASVLAHIATQLGSGATLDYASDWVTFGILSLEDSDAGVVQGAHALLSALTSTLAKGDLAKLVPAAHQAVKMTSAPVAGFNLPKGVSCILPIFLQGLSLGSTTDKEVSALAIADVVERTDEQNLKPLVTQIVGPLIRVVGERYPASVKAAIMYTLNVLLARIPQYLKPFLPQLQRTFAKSLADPTSVLLRTRAATALGTLVTLQTRIDPLAKEIIAGVRSAEDEGVRMAMLQSLFEILHKAGQHLSEPLRGNVLELIDEVDLNEANVRMQATVAKIAALTLALMGRSSIVKQVIGAPKLLAVLTANALLVYAKQFVTPDFANILAGHTQATDAEISENAVIGLGKYLLQTEDPTHMSAVVACVVKTDDHTPNVRRLALMVLRAVAKHRRHYLTPEVLDDLIVPLFAAVRDTTIPVKLAAEQAFLDVFDFVDRDTAVFDEWYQGAQTRDVVAGPQQRSLTEYVRRVALRHAAARREQESAGISQEDEAEIWQVGLHSEV
ncbi:eIF-2-alpha kinase activator GCN1 [Wickerhamiella sorbophila]|uniref:eIF-2-alpha kinase activator GCN1 n=1 Tax=Wickerhamiella sorbophila TaxID=45607 RepID=A0A2T0FC68_9ASCO|nr:eIF-2-alpha kinase activator GCN1 [Wickerhamiella sorbophila]PRT52604.1 eIF-2-alpha kinase activator GCN1 [Wickerhamiella sorbophila]